MAKAKTHKDVEFHVEGARKNKIFGKWSDAVENAVMFSLSEGGEVLIDVVVWSKSGARWWMGEEGAEMYEADPEASVFQRINIEAVDGGTVP